MAKLTTYKTARGLSNACVKLSAFLRATAIDPASKDGIAVRAKLDSLLEQIDAPTIPRLHDGSSYFSTLRTKLWAEWVGSTEPFLTPLPVADPVANPFDDVEFAPEVRPIRTESSQVDFLDTMADILGSDARRAYHAEFGTYPNELLADPDGGFFMASAWSDAWASLESSGAESTDRASLRDAWFEAYYGDASIAPIPIVFGNPEVPSIPGPTGPVVASAGLRRYMLVMSVVGLVVGLVAGLAGL